MGIFYKQFNSIPEFRINLPGEDPSGSKVFFFFFFLWLPIRNRKTGNWIPVGLLTKLYLKSKIGYLKFVFKVYKKKHFQRFLISDRIRFRIEV